MDNRAHWESVYSRKAANEVSWYQAEAERSLDLIRRTTPDLDAPIIDVGGGASTLVDGLLDSVREEHHTPTGTTQAFVYCLCRVEAAHGAPNDVRT